MTNEPTDKHKNQTMHTVELTDQEAYDAIEMLDHYADEMDVDRADELADKIEAAMDSDGSNTVPPGTKIIEGWEDMTGMQKAGREAKRAFIQRQRNAAEELHDL